MMLLVRNRVQDVERWKQVFDEQTEPARRAGLTVRHVWRSVDEDDQVFFLFDVQDRGMAEAFMSSPDSAQVGRESGVIGGDFHFLESM